MKTLFRMHTVAIALALSGAGLLGPSVSTLAAESNPSNATSIIGSNPLLANGAAALERGEYEEGLRLTLEGLKTPIGPQDKAAGYANACAGFAALKRWDEAIEHCNVAISLDANNWRAYNNRAAGYTGKGQYDRALADLEAGLKIAPESRTLRLSLQIVQEHKRLSRRRTRTAVGA